MEVELKYRMTDVATGERLLAADELAGFAATGPAETVRHEDRYLDTDGRRARGGGLLRSPPVDGQGDDHHAQGPRAPRRRRRRRTGARSWKARPIPSQPPAAWPASRGPGRRRRDRRRARAAGARRAPPGPPASGTTRATARSSRCPSTTSRSSSVRRWPSGSPSSSSSCARATRSNLEPLADMLGEIEELVAVDSSKFERALEVVRREPRESGARRGRRRRGGRGGGRRGRDPPLRPVRRAAAPTAQVGPGRRPRTRRPTARRDLRLSSRRCPTSRPSPSPSRRGSWCPSRPACWPTTTSPRPGGRSSGSTSPGWSRARPGPARARTPRSCTRCASRRVASERRGACSATPSTRSARRATGSGCASWRPTSARSATSTS